MPGSQLAIQLTVGADGLVEGLKIAGKTVDGAAQAMRASFGETQRSVGSLTSTLKDFKSEQVQQARTARFFANELGSIIPGAEGAKGALQGLIEVGLEGFGIGAAIQLTVLAMHQLNETLHEEQKLVIDVRNAHIETAAQIREALKSIDESFEKNITKVHKFKEEFAKGTREQGDAAKKAALTAIDESGGVVDFVKYMWQVIKEGPEHATPAIFKAVDDAYRGVLERSKEFEAERSKIGGTSALEKRAREETFYLQLEQEQIKANEALEQDIYQRALKRLNDEIAQDKRKDEAIKATREAGGRIEAENSKNREERLKRLSEVEAELAAKSIQEWSRAAQQIGGTFGQALAGIIGHTQNVGAAFKEMASEIVRAVVGAAIKSLEAYAVSAAGAAFFSQAGIPVIGPILAVGAAATAGAFIEGLIGSLPSAAVGMPRVGADGPVYVHKDEAILTTSQAQDWRAGRGGGGNGLVININKPMFVDRKSLKDLPQDPHFINGLNEARRNGRIP